MQLAIGGFVKAKKITILYAVCIFCYLLLFQNFSLSPTGQINPILKKKLWYQLSTGSQIADDFEDAYSNASQAMTSEALSKVGVYMITRKLWMDKSRRAFFLSKVAPLLKENNITLAINTTSAVWLACRYPEQISQVLQSELDVIRGIERESGLTVSHLALQSVLSKPLPRIMENGVNKIDSSSLPLCLSDSDLTTDDRISGVINFINFFKHSKPNLQVGIIDALLAQESALDGEVQYEDAYSKLYRRLNNRNLSLGFVLVDHPVEYLFEGSSLFSLKKLAAFLRYRGIKSGLIITSSIREPIFDKDGRNISIEIFKRRSKSYLRLCLSEQLNFDFYTQASWYPPINKDQPQLQLMNNFYDILSGTDPN